MAMADVPTEVHGLGNQDTCQEGVMPSPLTAQFDER